LVWLRSGLLLGLRKGLLRGLLLGLAGCAAAPEEGASPTSTVMTPVGTVAVTGAPVAFRYPNVLGGDLATDDLRGRVTVLLLVTTYDVPSQVEVGFLTRLHKEHVPRVNAALIVLEPPESRDIVREYVRALAIDYPVGMADAATIAGHGPFESVQHVPSVVILDREGRERFRHLGPMKYGDLKAAVNRVETESGVEKPK
jgi:hypothetical protein